MESGAVSVGHPVDVASGAVFTIAHDFELPGTLPMVWSRNYSTGSTTHRWQGAQWSNPLVVEIERHADRYVLSTEEGGTVVFPIKAGEPRTTRLVNFSANMELTEKGDSVTVLHWHTGDDDIYCMDFEPAGGTLLRLSAYRNLAGHRISVAYDRSGRPSRLWQELENRRVDLHYDDTDLLTHISMIDAEGRSVMMARYGYEGRNLVTAVNAAGGTTRYSYDSEGRMTSEAGELGAVFQFRYDKEGRCVHASGNERYMERTLRFDRARRATTVTNSVGDVTTYFCNPSGQVLQEVGPTGAITVKEFDQLGRIIAVKFPDGGEKRCEYDERGNRSRVIDPLGKATTFRFNDLHLPLEVIGPNGAVTTMEYDERGSLMSLTNAMDVRWEYERDERGLVTAARSPTGLVLRKIYGPDLRWYEVSDNLGLLRRFEYDGFGNPTAVYDGAKLLRRFHCDPAGRVLRLDIAGGRAMTFRWNAMDQIVERVGVAGDRDVWEYDIFGQLTAQVNPAGYRETLTYDTEGRLTSVTNRAGEVTRFTYDATGNVDEERTFDGRTIRYEHNLAGYPERVTNPDGRWIRHQFDVNGQLKVRETSDGLRQEYSYNEDGGLIAAKAGGNVVAWKRDLLGRVVQEQQGDWIVESEYDEEARRISRRIRDRPEFDLRWRYDIRGRTINVANNDRPVLETQWDTLDRRVQRTALGQVSDRLVYDSVDRLVEQETAIARIPVITRKYAWDGYDRLIRKNDSNLGQFEFDHDILGRLQAVTLNGKRSEFYRYDPNGTILETNEGLRDVAPGGRTLQTSDRHLEYGPDGTVALISTAKREMQLRYDAELQLVGVTASDGTDVAYEYDAVGRRTAKIVNGVKTSFLWDDAELLGTARNGKLDMVVLQENMRPRVMWWQGDAYALVPDEVGISSQVVSADGHVDWEGRFSAYGDLLRQSGSVENPFRFRGQYFDNETEFSYNVQRYYDPATQSFLSPDPLGIAAGTNPYEYPRNPIDWDDPFGLKCNKHREKMAERRMDKYYKDRGYKRITKPPSARSRAQGIDAVYYKKDGNPRYIIAEAKYGGNDLHTTTHSGEQQSNKWINTPVGDPAKIKPGSPPRLDEAVGASRAQTIRDASDNGLVRRDVFYAPEGQPRQVVGAPYTGQGPGSQNDTAGPFTPVPD